MKIEFWNVSRIAITAVLGFQASHALAQSAAGPDAQTQDLKAAETPVEIVVTGTRRANQIIAKSLSPVDIVEPQSLAASPSADLNDQLAESIPSFKVQRTPQADGAIFSRPATLRNLSPDQTLVLVNGHRRHRSAFVDIINQGSQGVDLSQISAASIGQIQVLRDGASAQYGSDAIAGVINILLNKTPGTVLTAQVGEYYAGDGFGAQISGRTGVALPGGGSLTVSGDYSHGDPTDRSTGLKYKVGQPEVESYHATYNLELPLSDAFNLYSFGTYGNTTGWSDFTYRDPNGSDAYHTSYFQTGPDAIYPDWSLQSLYPNGFTPQFGAVIKDVQLTAGVKGNLTDNLSLDVSADYGRNAINYRIRNSINASLGPVSPTTFNAGEIVESEASANVDLNYRLDAGLAGPVNIGFGVGYRNERFESIAGDVASYQTGPLSDLPSGAQGFPGLTADSTGVTARDNASAYIDVEADVTSRLTVGAAGRYEDFSDFGSNFSYKLSGRYQIIPIVAIRATYNTGFHAPAPGQQSFTKVTAGPDSTKPAPYPISTTALILPTDPLAVTYGGKPLTPETSRNISAGFVVQPTTALTLTLDYYRIAIKDRIGLTPQITLPDGSDYDRIQFLINGYETKTEGVDAVAAWRHQLSAGRLSLTAAYSYTKTDITRADPVVVTNVSRAYVEDALPHHTAIGTATFDTARLHLLGRVRYYGSFIDGLTFDQTALGFQNQKVTPRTFVDLSITYDVRQGTELTLGAENLFGTYPDRATSIISLLGYSYPYNRPYEEDGGRWYLRLTQRF